MEIRLLMNFLFMELCFMEIRLRMTKQVFITSFEGVVSTLRPKGGNVPTQGNL